jgi:sugar lactone lactonase YvrE
LGTLLTDSVNLNQPSGLQLSPDNKKLYVASSQNNRVVRYDYNFSAGTATNPTVFATAGLMFPNSILFSTDGNKVYVSNLGGSGVAQFNTDGSSAGAPINGAIAGGSIFQYSGLAHAPTGELLVGGFQDFPAAMAGGIAKSNPAVSSIADFIGPSPALNGAGNLLVIGNDLYATAGFAGRVNKYNATTGAVNATFNAPTNLEFPASMIRAPDGNGILVGILGFVDGTGSISRFGLDGTPLGVFAAAQANPANGFREPTGIIFVNIPEPATVGLLGIAVLASAVVAGRRYTAR